MHPDSLTAYSTTRKVCGLPARRCDALPLLVQGPPPAPPRARHAGASVPGQPGGAVSGFIMGFA